MDAAESNALIEAHVYLVDVIAKQIYRKIRGRIPLDDLRQEGLIALWKCAVRFDQERGKKFSSYACMRVKGAMLDAVRKEAGVRSYIDGEGERVHAGVLRRHVPVFPEYSLDEVFHLRIDARIDVERLANQASTMTKGEARAIAMLFEKHLGEQTQLEMARRHGVAESRVSQLVRKGAALLKAAAA